MCDPGTELLSLLTAADAEEFALGVCTAVAVLAHSLIEIGVLRRDEVLAVFDKTEAAVSNKHRKVALKAIRHFVEALGSTHRPKARVPRRC